MLRKVLSLIALGVLFLSGMAGGMAGTLALNRTYGWLPQDSGWLVAATLVLGFIAGWLPLLGCCAAVWLLDKCGIIDLKKHNEKYPGFP